MTKRKRINQASFNGIRALIDTKKLNFRQVSKVMGVSHVTVSRISKCSTFEEYQEYMRGLYKAYIQAAPKKAVEPSSTDDDPMKTPIYDTLCSIDKTLKELLAIASQKEQSWWEEVISSDQT